MGGWVVASTASEAGDTSLLEGPVCSDDNTEVFPSGAGGGDKVKLFSVGVVPK